MDGIQLPFQFVAPAQYRAEDFLKSHSNAFALGAIESWPAWPSYGLIIFGAAKVGKTHLASIFEDYSGASFLKKEEVKEVEGLDGLIQEKKAYILEDMYPWVQSHETVLFHLCNLVKERGASILMTAERSPALWGLGLRDLESRLSSFPAIRVEAPDDELLAAILVKKVSEMQIELDGSVQQYILTHTERSAFALIQLLERLDEASLVQQRKITIPLVKRVMERAC